MNLGATRFLGAPVGDECTASAGHGLPYPTCAADFLITFFNRCIFPAILWLLKTMRPTQNTIWIVLRKGFLSWTTARQGFGTTRNRVIANQWRIYPMPA
jgi:hypothetical protein